ncbi:MAG: 2-oxoacid:acceptor oxidoreductase family protein, partial [Kiritimatiellae bacterium]|nr:2-oxoacid:acceptor oxidoreductase family protein [Kiritimatiellia bacterium]
MHERILIAGSGGQGVVSLGKLLARLAAETIQHVTFFPAYGAEVRGGTSNCQVILSANEIAAPIAEMFDSM